MKFRKALLISIFTIGLLSSCHPSTTKSTFQSNKTTISTLPTIEPFIDLPEVRFSSTFEYAYTETLAYKMKVPYDDTYRVQFNNYVLNYLIYDEIGNKIEESQKEFTTNELKKDAIIYVVMQVSKGCLIRSTITATHNEAVMPYDPVFSHQPSDFQTSGTASKNASKIEYVKRPQGTYINSNNPELLTDADLNQALTRNNVTGEVFFTFEHNNGPTSSFYYGYQVKNTTDHNLYITIKNLGFQLDGPGSWLGQNEWIQFYNTKFDYDTTKWSEQQKEIFIAYYNFSSDYQPELYQPLTVVLPPNEKIYVMGGTTKDSFMNFNCFNTANKTVRGGCSNAAVLFNVAGGYAQATFYVYTNPDLIAVEKVHQGYVVSRDDKDFGSQYIGYDTCNGIVENEMVFSFDDTTISNKLPVTFTSYYKDHVSAKGNPYEKIDSTAHQNTLFTWYTHINPQYNSTAVGTDMTRYITIDAITKEEVVIDSDHYDGKGNLANIGNWMIDYQDRYNFVNQGSRNRKITLGFRDGGSVAVMMRDVNGKILDKKFTFTSVETFPFNNESFSYLYTLDIPAHTVVQIVMEYNLLANSNGGIRHMVYLS